MLIFAVQNRSEAVGNMKYKYMDVTEEASAQDGVLATYAWGYEDTEGRGTVRF